MAISVSTRRKAARHVRTLAAAAFPLALLLATTGAFAGEQARIEAARAASKELGEKLKSALTAAIAAGGAASAIDVCKTAANEIAGEVSRKFGMTVRRTALRVRNANNAPDPFERKVLEKFVADIARGADAAKLEHTEIVAEEGRTAFRYMKAITTAASPCLACHGTDIAPDVRHAIEESYPGDQATGFKAGELRGAFSVTLEIR